MSGRQDKWLCDCFFSMVELIRKLCTVADHLEGNGTMRQAVILVEYTMCNPARR